jgi:hypothetical protein
VCFEEGLGSNGVIYATYPTIAISRWRKVSVLREGLDSKVVIYATPNDSYITLKIGECAARWLRE